MAAPDLGLAVAAPNRANVAATNGLIATEPSRRSQPNAPPSPIGRRLAPSTAASNAAWPLWVRSAAFTSSSSAPHATAISAAVVTRTLTREAFNVGSTALAALAPSTTTGIRRPASVTRNLTVADINWLKRSVTVIEDPESGRTVKSGKHRTVYLPEYVVTELSAAAAGRGREELFWPSAAGGYLKPPSPHDSWLSGAVKRCQRAADAARADEVKAHPDRHPFTPVFPRVTAHDLRHTAASLAISAGANVKAVQRMLGHASAAMTLDVYADLFDDDLAAVADRLQESVGNLWARERISPPETEETPACAGGSPLASLAPPDGLEPSTARLTVGSSAN